MRNKAYLKEIKVAFNAVRKLKGDTDTLLSKFDQNLANLSKAEKDVLERFQKHYQRDIINFKNPKTVRYNACMPGIADLIDDIENGMDWEDLGPGWQSDVDMEEVEEGRESDISCRKMSIADLAQLKVMFENFQSEFLEAMSAAQVKKEEIAAPKVQEKQTSSQSVTSDTMFERLKKMAQRVYATVKNTVSNVIETVKTSVEDMITRIKRTVATIMA